MYDNSICITRQSMESKISSNHQNEHTSIRLSIPNGAYVAESDTILIPDMPRYLEDQC